MYRKYTPVESCLNIYEERYWYYIPNFNGYEISNDGYIRSMKHYKDYPFGIMLKPVKSKAEANTTDPLFILSNNNNERVRIRLSQLAHLAFTNPYGVSGYPRGTMVTDMNPRNDRHFVKKKRSIPQIDNTRYYPKFTIIQDGTETIGMYQKEPDVRVPVISIKGEEYYGRKDCRTFCSPNVLAGPEQIFSRG